MPASNGMRKMVIIQVTLTPFRKPSVSYYKQSAATSHYSTKSSSSARNIEPACSIRPSTVSAYFTKSRGIYATLDGRRR